MVTYEAMTLQCGRSVVRVLVVRVDIGVVTYEAMTPQCGRSNLLGYLRGYRVSCCQRDTGDIFYFANPVWENDGYILLFYYLLDHACL